MKFKSVVVAAIMSISGLLTSSAQAQLAVEGASFKLSHNKSTKVLTAAGAATVANYFYEDANGFAVVVMVSNKNYSGQGNFSGTTVARTSVDLPARTRVNNIPLNGKVKVSSYKTAVVFVVDSSNQIFGFANLRLKKAMASSKLIKRATKNIHSSLSPLGSMVEQ